MATYTTGTKNRFVKALLDLIATKPLDDISVSELSERAQINRASFYRNFRSKEDVLIHAFTQRIDAWKATHEVMRSAKGSPYLQTRGFFDFMVTERALIELLSKARVLDNVLLTYLIDAIGPSSDDGADDVFYRMYHLYGVFGIYREWVRRGMRESPDKMARLVVYGVHDEHPSLVR